MLGLYCVSIVSSLSTSLEFEPIGSCDSINSRGTMSADLILVVTARKTEVMTWIYDRCKSIDKDGCAE